MEEAISPSRQPPTAQAYSANKPPIHAGPEWQSTVPCEAVMGAADDCASREETEIQNSEGKLHVKRRWTKPRCVLITLHVSILSVLMCSWITNAIKRYSYAPGQTEVFKHFVNIKDSLLQYFGTASLMLTSFGICRYDGRPAEALGEREEKTRVCPF